MGRSKKQAEKYDKAYNLFVNTNMSQTEVAETVGVAQRTMSEWVNADNEAWRMDRAARSVTKEEVIRGYYAQLAELNEQISNKDQGQRFASASEADTILKIQKAIKGLENRYDVSTYYQVLDELMKWITIRNPKVAQVLAMDTVDFLKQKMREINVGK